MNEPLSELQLAEIRELAAAATPGPWLYDAADREVMTGHGITVADIHPADDDGRFIAHARTDVPELLAEVARLRTQVADLTDQRNAARAVVAEQQEQLADARPPARHTPTRGEDGVHPLAGLMSAVEQRIHLIDADPTPLRWGLDDIEYGDDDTTWVLLSGPDLEPYVLELEPEQADVLRNALAGPAGDTTRAEVLREAAGDFERRCPEKRAKDALDMCYCHVSPVLIELADEADTAGGAR